MKNIVIFGATGNIGLYFVDYCMKHFNENEYKIYAVGRKVKDFFKKNSVDFLSVDIRNKTDFEKLPRKVYAVVMLAGILPAYTENVDPYLYLDTNVYGGINVLEYAKNSNADRIIYTQTWADLAGYWGKEEVLSPTMDRKLIYSGDHAFYSITKCFIVDSIKYYQEQYGIKGFIFRLPNIYLYSSQKYYYVDGIKKLIGYRYMIDKAIAGEDIELWGNPNAFKDIIYIKDLCKMMYLAIEANVNGGIYNAGTGIKTTLQEQIEGMINVFSPQNKKSKIIYRPEKSSFTSFVMDISNARNDLGYEPDYNYLDYLLDYKKEMQDKKFEEKEGE